MNECTANRQIDVWLHKYSICKMNNNNNNKRFDDSFHSYSSDLQWNWSVHIWRFLFPVWKLIKIHYCMHNIYLTYFQCRENTIIKMMLKHTYKNVAPFLFSLFFAAAAKYIKYRISFCQTTHKMNGMNEWILHIKMYEI